MDDEKSSVDAILQNLTKRPNVRSTLILSRKNGSIIKSSGLIANDTNVATGLQPSYGADEQPLAENQTFTEDADAVVESTEASVQEPKLSRAQVLAGSIFAFVAAAVDLGGSLQNLTDMDEPLSGVQDTTRDGSQENSDSTQTNVLSEDDVQLLRLRLKKQEIIIFPDPNYLCCVVQDLERNIR